MAVSLRFAASIVTAAMIVAAPAHAGPQQETQQVSRRIPTPTAQTAPAATAEPAATATTIAQEIAGSASHLTLEKLIQATNLEATLAAPGAMTVFAPSDDAFGRLAPGTIDTLMKPENKATLAKLLKYHVVPGARDAETLKKEITAAGGSTTLTTIAGQPLTVSLENGAIVLTDVNGNKSYITQYDVEESNGVIHYVNGVVIPTLG